MRAHLFRQHAVGMIKTLVPAAVLRARSEHRFFHATAGFQNLHLGKFASFEQARAFAQRHGATAHYALDHDEWAQVQSTLKAHDYAVLYWLQRLLRPGATVVDLGGSVGVCYYLFQQRIAFPADLSWVVCELPEVVAQGRAQAHARHAVGLRFSTDRSVLDGCSLLLCAGALQFIEPTLPEILAALPHPPADVLLNRTPLIADTPAFVTLQHTGVSFAPVRVDNLHDFVAAMHALGYSLVDDWKCHANSLSVPLHEECQLDYFLGAYFHRDPAAAGPQAPTARADAALH